MPTKVISKNGEIKPPPYPEYCKTHNFCVLDDVGIVRYKLKNNRRDSPCGCP